ncbi:MAG: TrmH family RNA methyltransferase [Clostridiales bacterium]|nr:TrmH family RNA methyltransferase [Clostridiales bacterium]
MGSLQKYKKTLPYSYALGMFPSMEAALKKPETCKRLLLHSKGENSEGAQKLVALCKDKKIRVEQADRLLTQISPKGNVFAAMVFEKFEEPLSNSKPHIVLHQLSDAGNIGTILRTALGFGFTDIGFITPCADVFDPQVIRASMGAAFSQRLSFFQDFTEYQQEYVDHQSYLFMLDGAKTLEDATHAHKEQPFTLVLGNEGKGLPQRLKEMGTAVKIPHGDQIDSLNVAIAAAIGMYEFSKKRKEK